MRRKWLGLAAAAGVVTLLHTVPMGTSERPAGRARIGNPSVLDERWKRWEAAYARAGGDRARVMSLRWSPSLSTRRVHGFAQARLDLVDGHVTAGLAGLDAGTLWLVDQAPDRGAEISPADRFLRLGDLHAGELLDADVAFGGLEPDLLVVTEPGRTPLDGALLAGHTTLFARLHDAVRREPPAPRPRRRIIRLAEAQDPQPDLEALIASGEALFTSETFDGNGRTCETCHPARNNFTIDPAFVASLPADDPLFVASQDPALVGLEDPTLLTNQALVKVNSEGFDAPAVLRGVPHTLALATSLEPPSFLFDGTTSPPLERLGWGGDGAPGDGTLREFAIGAIMQHETRSLQRVTGVDFRLPTEDELDALEAFQLSLGRLDDPDLSTLRLRDANAAAGLVVFEGSGKCEGCHANAGADVPGGGNASFDTGVARLPTRLPLPTDDGFATTGRFNTPPAIEAADTGPWFHDNAVGTLDAAVGFYGGQTFNDSPAGVTAGGIRLSNTQRTQIVAFLTVMNALENVRSADAYDDRAAGDPSLTGSRTTIDLAIAEVDDAIGVLNTASLHADAVSDLRQARKQLVSASQAARTAARNAALSRATTLLASARARMVVE